ncbi:ATP phosphoribosyltransferase [archaeon]|nr:ATP phosphoribosyltransferase [archaeon]MBT4022333.1 ATP phosphoribosyltransferase [archaeon]MBT4273211.1 ATP phosphoribosyltransferase [archaeon]MBT4461346.1 ATP phosphoribosyltransferase [archaeon]MBT4858910.1 ATP phosphoribosyltransferase [archaeon]
MKIKLALPKGRLYNEIESLLKDAEIKISTNGRNYRPNVNDPEIQLKILKPQNIPKLVELGSQDVAFTGYDWVLEQNADVEELMDLSFNPVKIVAAIPKQLKIDKTSKSSIRVVSEYEKISRDYLDKKGFNYVFIKSFGATESFIPEDADMIIDNTSTGRTLKENNLVIYDDVLKSSTRLIANKDAINDPWKKKKIENLITLFQSVLEARNRVLIEMNVSEDKLDTLIPKLPCMKSPTISKLYGEQGYAIKIAVTKDKIPNLIPLLKKEGATDILVFDLKKVIP